MAGRLREDPRPPGLEEIRQSSCRLSYALTSWFGARMFSHAREAVYRRVPLALLWTISALLVGRAAFGLLL